MVDRSPEQRKEFASQLKAIASEKTFYQRYILEGGTKNMSLVEVLAQKISEPIIQMYELIKYRKK